MRAALVSAGMTPAAIDAEMARLPKRPDLDDFEVDEDDEGRAIGLFLAMGSQWRWAGMGERVGLDNNALAATAAPFGIDVDARIMIDLADMEAAALAAWDEKRAR